MAGANIQAGILSGREDKQTGDKNAGVDSDGR